MMQKAMPLKTKPHPLRDGANYFRGLNIMIFFPPAYN